MKLFIHTAILTACVIVGAHASEFPAGSCPAPAGVIGEWSADSLGGGKILDTVGTNDGAFFRSLTIQDGLVGNAMHSTNGGAMRTNGAYHFPRGSNFSIEMWVKPEEYPDIWTTFVEARTGQFFGHLLSLASNGLVLSGGRCDNQNNSWSANSAPQVIELGRWQHVAVTVDWSTNQNIVYVDGQPSSEVGNLASCNGLTQGGPFGLGALNFFYTNPAYQYNGKIDEVRIYDRALSPIEIRAIHDCAGNHPPTAHAGTDQSIRAGESVVLDGSASFDDNTDSASLLYSWNLSVKPLASNASLTDADTPTPALLTDLPGTYEVALVVTDTGGLQSSSPADDLGTVLVSTENLAPTALAGEDRLVVIGTPVSLDGSGSIDPESDPLTYAWTLITPGGSSAGLSGASSATPLFTPDVPGVYDLTLNVSDFIGPGVPDAVAVTAATAEGFAEYQILQGSDTVAGLSSEEVTTGGNQQALLNFLSQAIVAIQADDLAGAVGKLQMALLRTDGCVLRGVPDGSGPGRDWITDCDAQTFTYDALTLAVEALTLP